MKIGVNLWFLTLIIAIIKVSFTKNSGYKVSKLHLPLKLLRPHAVILGRQPGMLLEEGAEGRGIREAEFTGYLLNRLVRILHQINAATDNRLENQLLNRLATYRLHYHRKILRGETKLVGIKSYRTLTHKFSSINFTNISNVSILRLISLPSFWNEAENMLQRR